MTDTLNDSTACIYELRAQVAALTEQRDEAIAACREVLPIMRQWDHDGLLATAMVETVCRDADASGIKTESQHAAALANTEEA